MSRPVKLMLGVGYVVLLLVLFRGIKALEGRVRQGYYTHVTRRMVTETSKLPPERCVLGVYKPELPYSFDPMERLEDSLNLRFTLVSFYQAWGDEPHHRFKPALMDRIVEQGCVPVVTWEPWVSQFSREDLEPMPRREYRSLADIADGVYDFHIGAWARAAVGWGKPFFLRFAHEMTNPQYPWSPGYGNRPEDYRRAWWHVREVFDSLGAHNVIWVWCPYGTDVLEYYPGDGQVDWVAMDVFNYGELLSGEREIWLSFDQLASPLYRELAGLRKPIMVAEVGSGDIGGSRAVWYREMLTQIRKKFTLVKAVVLFDNPADRTSGRFTIDWSIDSDRDVLREMRSVLDGGYYVYQRDYLETLSKHEAN